MFAPVFGAAVVLALGYQTFAARQVHAAFCAPDHVLVAARLGFVRFAPILATLRTAAHAFYHGVDKQHRAYDENKFGHG